MQARDQTATALDLAQSAASMLTDHSDLAPYVRALVSPGGWKRAVHPPQRSRRSPSAPTDSSSLNWRASTSSGCARAMSSSADHVAIDELVQRFVPSTALVELPRAGHGSSVSEPAGARSGWLTVAHPDDHRSRTVGARRARLLRLAVEAADAGCAPRVVDFASLLGVSAVDREARSRSIARCRSQRCHRGSCSLS